MMRWRMRWMRRKYLTAAMARMMRRNLMLEGRWSTGGERVAVQGGLLHI